MGINAKHDPDYKKLNGIITIPSIIYSMADEHWCAMSNGYKKTFKYKAYRMSEMLDVTGFTYLAMRSLIYRAFIPPPLFLCYRSSGNRCWGSKYWTPCYLFEEMVAIAQKAHIVYSRQKRWSRESPETSSLRLEMDIIRSDIIRREILTE